MGKIFASKSEKWENFDAKTGVIFGGKKALFFDAKTDKKRGKWIKRREKHESTKARKHEGTKGRGEPLRSPLRKARTNKQ